MSKLLIIVGFIATLFVSLTIATTCPQDVVNEWVQSACNTAGWYSCPLQDYYVDVPFVPEYLEPYYSDCIAKTVNTTNHLCGSTFGWVNAGCSETAFPNYGPACVAVFYCK